MRSRSAVEKGTDHSVHGRSATRRNNLQAGTEQSVPFFNRLLNDSVSRADRKRRLGARIAGERSVRAIPRLAGELGQMKKNFRRQQWMFTIGYLFWLLLMFWLIRTTLTPVPPRQVSYSDFMDEVKAGHLEQVHITEQHLLGTLKKDQLKQTNKKTPPNPLIECSRIPGLSAAPLVQELEAEHLNFSGTISEPSIWGTLLISWGPILLLIVIYFIAMRRMQQRGGGPLSFGRNKAKIHDQSDRLETRFSDVAGVEEAKDELQEIIDFLKNPQKYQRLGGRIPKGVLLSGAAGNRQNAARPRGRRRIGRAVFFHLRIGICGNVRGRGRVARPRSVRAGQAALAVHHFYR